MWKKKRGRGKNARNGLCHPLALVEVTGDIGVIASRFLSASLKRQPQQKLGNNLSVPASALIAFLHGEKYSLAQARDGTGLSPFLTQ